VTSNSPDLWIDRLPTVDESSNKYTRGHAVVFGGYPMTGAARLAARACARVGAGLTTILVEPRALDIYAKHLESIMVRTIDNATDAATVLADRRITAILVGPGLGPPRTTRALTEAALGSGRAVVVDADALTAYEGDSELLFHQLRHDCVLTPHEGEFSRLFTAHGDRVERAMAAAKTCGAVVVLKGSQTVIADPSGTTVVNPVATPYLATAGSGDVLAGIITGLIAQGMGSFDAACASVWIHGEIGRHLGVGMIADDMPDTIPRVLRDLGSVDDR